MRLIGWTHLGINIGEIERRLMQKGWTAAEWANQAGVNRATARRLLRGKPVSPKQYHFLTKALGEGDYLIPKNSHD